MFYDSFTAEITWLPSRTIYKSICLSFYQSVCLSVYLSPIYLSVFLSIFLSFCTHCWKCTIRFQVKTLELFLWIMFICRLLSYILNLQKMPPREFWVNQLVIQFFIFLYQSWNSLWQKIKPLSQPDCQMRPE